MDNNYVLQKIRQYFDGFVLGYEELSGILTITVKPVVINDLISYLKKEPEPGFGFLTDICGVHYPDQENELGVVYHLHNMKNNMRIRIKTFVTREYPIGILASSVQLNESEALKWLRNKDGSKVSAKDLKTKCSFQIPNTVIAYWAGELGGVGRWWVNWNSNIDNLKKTGYMVNEYDGSENTASHHDQNLLHSAVAESQLYGTYYWGHGNTKGLANSTDKHYLLEYSNLKITYKIGFAHIYACESNSGKSAFNSTIWTGFTGTLYPINPWDFDWDNPSTP